MPRRRRLRQSRASKPPTAPTALRPSARALWCAAAVFVVALAVYLATLCPTVIDEDSGELAAAAHVLGIPHPTGYPLWTMLARACDFLPVGHTTAYRVALLSALSGASAAALLAWLVVSLTGMALPGAFAGIAFALWLPMWSQAVRPEVYALEAMLFAVFLITLWRWNDRRSPRRLLWVGLAGGFVAMHHRTGFLAAAPALVAAFWLTRPRRGRSLLPAAAAFIAPFLCYLYLPIRAAARPSMNWGYAVTAERFFYHVLGRQYARWAFANPLEQAAKEAARLLGEALAGPLWLSVLLAAVGLPFIFWGMARWCRTRPAVTVPLLAGAALLAVWVVEWGDTSDPKVWLTPLGLVLAMFGGAGLSFLADRPPLRRLGLPASAAAGIAVCGLLLFANWARADQSGVWRHRDRWWAALSRMDRKAIFVCEWDDPMFAGYYLQNVEGFRKDVTILRPHGLWNQWYVDLIEDPELRGVSQRLWREVTREYGLKHPGTPEFWEGTALFAYRLAQHYRGRRTVYTLHGPYKETLPGPPYFVGLTDRLYRLDFTFPDLAPIEDRSRPIVAFAGGIQLLSLGFSTSTPKNGDLVEFRARWRLDQPLPGALFAVQLVPEGAGPRQYARLAARGEFAQGFPVLYGQWGLPASPAGTAYEQKGALLIPSNAPPGRYRVRVGFAQAYPPHYGDWREVPGLTLDLRPPLRPLPTNGP